MSLANLISGTKVFLCCDIGGAQRRRGLHHTSRRDGVSTPRFGLDGEPVCKMLPSSSDVSSCDIIELLLGIRLLAMTTRFLTFAMILRREEQFLHRFPALFVGYRTRKADRPLFPQSRHAQTSKLIGLLLPKSVCFTMQRLLNQALRARETCTWHKL